VLQIKGLDPEEIFATLPSDVPSGFLPSSARIKANQKKGKLLR